MLQNVETMKRHLDWWSTRTFSDAYSYWKKSNPDRELDSMVQSVLKLQNKYNAKMNGYCSSNNLITNRENLRITYRTIPSALDSTVSYWTPFNVIVYVCQHILSNKSYYKNEAGHEGLDVFAARMTGRALRAIPSTIREIQMGECVQKWFPDGVFEQNEALDFEKHADLMMNWHNNTYYFESFIAQRDSIANFLDKFSGRRGGMIPKGYHIICGFNMSRSEQKTTFREWYMYSDKYFDKIKNLVDNNQYYTYDEAMSDDNFNLKLYDGPVLVYNDHDRYF